MTVQQHDSSQAHIERTFTAVRAALPTANVAAFDAELAAIAHGPVINLRRKAASAVGMPPGSG